MSKPWLLVTPASKGIGFRLARYLLKSTDAPVVATARTDLNGTKDRILQNLDVDKKRLRVLKLDVTSIALSPPSQQQSFGPYFS